MNPLYLIINSATEYFKEENDEIYLIIDSTEKYEEVFFGINSKIKTINDGEEMFYEENYGKNGVNTGDDIPLKKQIKFPTLTIIIRCAFKESSELYSKIYLDECLYEL